ncbi:MAG: hypothetical protein QM831_36480 [Kofleriaceae bacterium]
MAVPQAASGSDKLDAFACAQCGAAQTFDPGTSRLICDHCGTAVAIVLANDAIPSHDLFGKEAITSLHASELQSGARTVTCKSCGAQAIVTRRADRCAFCAAPLVIETDDGAKTIPPGGVVPFKIDAKAAGDAFGKWMTKRRFAPSDLTSRSQKGGLDGVYLPYWTFDASSTTQYDGQRGTVRMVSESFTNSEGKTETRQVEHVDWTPKSGTVSCKDTNVMAIASSSLPEKLVKKLEPWDLVHARGFDPRFLAGFVAECYKVQPADGFTNAYPIIEQHIRNAINRDIGGDRQQIDSMNVNWDAVAFRHLLLPLWLASFRYNDKVFHVAVNAQTGEVVGERPWSVGKIVMLVVAIAAAITALVVLIAKHHH